MQLAEMHGSLCGIFLHTVLAAFTPFILADMGLLSPCLALKFGVFSIPLLIIRQSKLDHQVSSCGTQQVIPLNHVCPISREHWTQRFDTADDQSVI